MSYEILGHTADEKFRSVGETREEAFSEAIKAFAEIVGADPEAGSVRHSFEVEAKNMESLFFDFLDQLIYLQDTEGVAVTHAEEISFEEKEDGFRIETVVWTDPITGSMSLQDIKAPTYNEMKAGYEEGEGWVLEAVLDI